MEPVDDKQAAFLESSLKKYDGSADDAALQPGPSARLPLASPTETGAPSTTAVDIKPPASEQEEEEEEVVDLAFAFRSLVALMKPVSITMIVTVLMAVHLADPNSSKEVGLNGFLASDEDKQDNSDDKFKSALVSALIFVGAIIAATFLLLACYWCRWFKGLYAWLIVSVVALLAGTGTFVITRFLKVVTCPTDVITFYLGIWNFSVVGVLAIFWKAPNLLKQSYLIAISAIMAFIIVLLPEWTTWTFLIILAVYDLCAVLTPCGPLKCLIEMAQDREEPIPALLYEAHPNRGLDIVQPAPANPAVYASAGAALSVASSSTPAPSETRSRNGSGDDDQQIASVPLAAMGQRSKAQDPIGHGNDTGFHPPTTSSKLAFAEDYDPFTIDPDRSVKLGLGDFVMYSVLVGRAAGFGFATLVACFLAVLSGLAATLTFLAVFRKALPALPVSIAFGVAWYFLTRALINPFMEEFILWGGIGA